MLVGPAAACDRSSGAGTAAADDRSPTSSGEARVIGATEAAEPPPEGLATAIFAGGCFWCMEHPFERLDGVGEVVSGYTGGEVVGPSYRDVAYGRTDHLEAVRVVYDPDRIAYETLVEVFFLNVDPTQSDGQFCDRGEQYRTAIFVDGPEQRAAARKAKEAAAETLDEPIVTPIRDAGPFYVAEDYHQNYYRTHAAQYQRYRRGCGRDARLRALWGDRAGGEGVAN
jgi:peptide-methionine (S)-S-oxide reductase